MTSSARTYTSGGEESLRVALLNVFRHYEDMAITIARTVRASDLSRDSAAVFRAADDGPVEVTRRDAEPLVLTRRSSLDQQYAALEIAADLVAASLGPDEEPLTDRLLARFPWLEFLTDAERAQFGAEMISSARACAAIREFTPFLAELHAWYATASAKAAGYTASVELDWYDTPVTVDDPHAD